MEGRSAGVRIGCRRRTVSGMDDELLPSSSPSPLSSVLGLVPAPKTTLPFFLSLFYSLLFIKLFIFTILPGVAEKIPFLHLSREMFLCLYVRVWYSLAGRRSLLLPSGPSLLFLLPLPGLFKLPPDIADASQLSKLHCGISIFREQQIQVGGVGVFHSIRDFCPSIKSKDHHHITPPPPFSILVIRPSSRRSDLIRQCELLIFLSIKYISLLEEGGKRQDLQHS